MAFHDNFKNQAERERMTPPEPVVAAYDYKGDPIYEGEDYYSFNETYFKPQDAMDYLLALGAIEA